MPVEQKSPHPPMFEMEPAVRYYLFLACAGLLTLGLAIFEKGELFALPVVVFGAIGIVPSLLPPRTVWARLARKIPAHAMPPLVLLWLVVVEILFGYGSRRDRGVFNFSDLLTCAGLLAYLAGQYRLLGLRFQAVPADIRPRTDRTGGDEPETWPESLTSPQNLKWLAIVLPVAIVFAQLCWFWIVSGGEWRFPNEGTPLYLGLRDEMWRFASLIWLLGVGAILLVSFLGAWHTYRMTAEEARMIGQDALWVETRGEQRRTSRWSAWARRKWFRKTGQQP